MKLAINKKKMKSLTKDKGSLPAKATPLIAGGISYLCENPEFPSAVCGPSQQTCGEVFSCRCNK